MYTCTAFDKSTKHIEKIANIIPIYYNVFYDIKSMRVFMKDLNQIKDICILKNDT